MSRVDNVLFCVNNLPVIECWTSPNSNSKENTTGDTKISFPQAKEHHWFFYLQVRIASMIWFFSYQRLDLFQYRFTATSLAWFYPGQASLSEESGCGLQGGQERQRGAFDGHTILPIMLYLDHCSVWLSTAKPHTDLWQRCLNRQLTTSAHNVMNAPSSWCVSCEIAVSDCAFRVEWNRK